MALDNLAVSISSQTADVQAGIQSVRSSFDGLGRDATESGAALSFAGDRADDLRDDSVQLAGALQLLQGRADEAGDEIAQAGRRATTTGGMFSALTLSTEGTAISFGTLSSVTTLSLIPSLFTLSAVLAPLIATLALLTGGAVALGGAFATVVGLGVAGGFDEIKQALIELRDAVWPFVKLVGQQFTPLILDAIEAMRPLAFEILAVIGSHADAFTESLRSLGQQVADVLPGLVEGFFELAEAALPVFENFIAFLDANGGDILSGIRESAQDVLPVLSDLLDAIIDFIPEFTEFGGTVANVVIPALTDLFEHGTRVLEWINGLDPKMQGLVATGLALAPVIAKLGSLIVSLGSPLALVLGAVAALGAAWATNFGGIRDIAADTWQRLQSILGNRVPVLIDELKRLFQTLLPIIEPIFSALLGVVGEFVTTGLDVVLTTLTAIVKLLNGDVSGAFEMMGRLMIRVANAVLRAVTMMAEGVVNSIIEAVNHLSTAINDRLIATLPEDVQRAVGEDAFVTNMDPVSFQAPQISGGREPLVGQQIDRARQQDQRVVIELKDELLEGRIRSGARTELRQESRARDRQRDRGLPTR